jgi:hypothetical protein
MEAKEQKVKKDQKHAKQYKTLVRKNNGFIKEWTMIYMSKDTILFNNLI